MKNQPSTLKLESWLVTAGRFAKPGAPLNVPPIPASNFTIGAGREYARDDGTPTWEALEEIVGGLESGRAVAFASGMAAIAAAFDQLEAFLAVRGSRTLALRLQRAQQTAMVLAERLERHPQVSLARYPGLASHPTHATARRVLKGFGTIISFDVHGGAQRADAVCKNIRLICHATSLGAVESTIERRAAIPGQGHLPPSLLRLSVGIEDVDDLWMDLDQALLAAAGVG